MQQLTAHHIQGDSRRGLAKISELLRMRARCAHWSMAETIKRRAPAYELQEGTM